MSGFIILILIVIAAVIFIIGRRSKTNQTEQNVDNQVSKQNSETKAVSKILYVFGLAPLSLLFISILPGVPWGIYNTSNYYRTSNIHYDIWRIVQFAKDMTDQGRDVGTIGAMLVALIIVIICSILVSLFPPRLRAVYKQKGDFPHVSWSLSVIGALFGVIVTCFLIFGPGMELVQYQTFGDPGISWLLVIFAGLSMLIYLIILVVNNKRLYKQHCNNTLK